MAVAVIFVALGATIASLNRTLFLTTFCQPKPAPHSLEKLLYEMDLAWFSSRPPSMLRS